MVDSFEQTPPPPSSQRLREYYREILFAHADDPVLGACLICRQTRCAEWRHAYERLACAEELPQAAEPWRGLLNGDGSGAS